MKIDIMNTEYEIIETNERDNNELENSLGYQDGINKVICLDIEQLERHDKKSCQWFKNEILRHEIIHAYLIEHLRN
jgi:hypothetical protein